MRMGMLGCPNWDCKWKRSVTCDSFAHAHLTLIQLVDCIFWWLYQIKQSDISIEIGISVKSAIDWHNFL